MPFQANLGESSETRCPVCQGRLIASDRAYSIDELLSIWTSVKFSAAVLEEHRKQSAFTQMHSCETCGLDIFLPQIIGTSGFYEEILKHSDNSYYESFKWEFGEALRDIYGCSLIVDMGCGSGNFLEKASKTVPNVYGVEYNRDAIEVARSKGLKIFEHLDDAGVSAVKGQADAVFSFHVLEHVKEPLTFVRDLADWVKPGGIIGISVPNMDGPIKYIDQCAMNMPPHHATRWRLKTLMRLAEELNFSMERYSFEPLPYESNSYYSFHWVSHVLPGNGLIKRIVRRMLDITLKSIFGIINLLYRRPLPFLRGQSIYVLLRKPVA